MTEQQIMTRQTFLELVHVGRRDFSRVIFEEGLDLSLCRLTYNSDTLSSPLIFEGAVLRNANFRKAIIRGPSFKNADLSGASFVQAEIHECDFSFANLSKANFYEMGLSGFDFSFANLTDVDFRGAILACEHSVSSDCTGKHEPIKHNHGVFANLTSAVIDSELALILPSVDTFKVRIPYNYKIFVVDN